MYDADPAAPGRLLNASMLARLEPGGRAPFAGFVLAGPALKQLLIRGLGPALTQFGLSGPVAAPQLRLFSGADLVADNGDWRTAANAPDIAAATALVGAFPLRADNPDAALLVSLRPGAYTVHLLDGGNAPGVALVEVHGLP